MEKSEATKKKSEPALAPEWLKAASSGVSSSGGGSIHHFASSSQSGFFFLPNFVLYCVWMYPVTGNLKFNVWIWLDSVFTLFPLSSLSVFMGKY